MHGQKNIKKKFLIVAWISYIIELTKKNIKKFELNSVPVVAVTRKAKQAVIVIEFSLR